MGRFPSRESPGKQPFLKKRALCTPECEKTRLTLQSQMLESICSSSEKGVFWQRGLFRKVYFLLEILENLEILEILENPQTVENKGESEHLLEIVENLEISEIRGIPPVKRPLW